MTNWIFTILFLLIWSYGAYGSERLHKERVYQLEWCAEQGGVTEYVLPDRTRVDCLTDTHAIEIDFADQWYCAVGQALHYARMAEREPGIALILEHPEDEKYLERLRPIAAEAGIRVWVIKP